MLLNHKIQGEGPPVIILHGLFGSLDNWQGFAGKLAGYGFRVVSVDLRNHGRSPHSDEFNYDVMAADLKELIDSLKLSDPFLLGHSMGGKVIMKFSTLFPDLTEGIIVVDIAPRYYPVHHTEIIEGLKAIPVHRLNSRAEADEILASHIHANGIRQFLLKNLARSNDGFRWKMNLPVIEKEIEHVGEEITAEDHIKIPALFVKGTRSDYITFDDEKEIFELFSDVDIKSCENAGHWVHVDAPDCLLSYVVNFITGNT
jgi:pimeloyl-ACP methyl ester carboxylesterase